MGDSSIYYEYAELLCDSVAATSAGVSGALSNDWPLFNLSNTIANVAGIKVIEAEIPNIFDAIGPNNNTFIFNDNAINYTITIATGNYTGADLATALQTAMAAIRPGFTVTYNSTTWRFTFTQPAAVSWGLTFSTKYTLYSVLGFRVTFYSASGAGSTITSPFVAQVSGPLYLSINSFKFGRDVNINRVDQLIGSNTPQEISSVICRVPVNVQKGAVIFYRDANLTQFFDYLRYDFDSFDLFLSLGYDQNQIPLDMKGFPWSVKLGLYIYRKDALEKGAPRIGATR
jgi:hypothetical protein